MKNSVKILICIILILSVAGGAYFYYSSTRFKYNVETATGNTAGNLNNGGMFCEHNGKIYFSNPCDNGYLYVMDSDCSNARKLINDSVESLNVCRDYLFYVRNNLSKMASDAEYRGQMFGVYRADLNGENPEVLYDSKAAVASLYGNYLYYQHYDKDTALTLYKVKIDGKEEKKLSDTPYNPASVHDGRIYFSDPDHQNQISYLDTQSDRVIQFYETNAYQVDAADNYIYFIDVSKGYSLVRLNTGNKTLELLYQAPGGKVINYNRYGNKIFFQVEGENTGLYRINADGTQVEFIAPGNVNHINCTSQYTFFQYYEDSKTLYRIPTSGPITKVEEITIK